MEIKIYGGINEIGGNKIFINVADKNFLFDYGLSFTQRGNYYSEFLKPRNFNGIIDLIKLNLIPPINHLYRNDLITPFTDVLNNPPYKIRETDENIVDAFFLSHAHMDHYNYVGLLKKNTRFYMNGITALILDYLTEVSLDNSSGRQILKFYEFQKKVPFVRDPTKFKRATKRDFKDEETARNVKIIQKGEKIPFKSNEGEITISQFSTDHSLPGASAYIVEHDGRSIIYTGDFRNHGFHSNLTNEFIQAAKKSNPIAIITEGTNVPPKKEFLSKEKESDEFSENQVKEQSEEIIKEHSGLLLVNFSQRNLDRILTFYEIAKDCGKIFAITPKMFRYLQKFREYFTGIKTQTGKSNSDLYNIPAEDDKNLTVYFPRKSWGLYENVDYKTVERKIFVNYPHITCKEIKSEPENYLLYADYFMMNELIDIKPDPGNSIFIHSQTDAFNEEMIFKDEKLNAWLDHFGIKRTEPIHSSGHCYVNDLISALKTINADNLIPIHTENPHTFEEFGLNSKILIAKIGKVLKI